MRILMLLVVGLAVGGVMLYFFVNQQQDVQVKMQGAQQSAQEKADEYRKNQETMMKQIEGR